MAVFLNNGCYVSIATVNLSDHVASVTVNQNFDEVETTAMTATGHTFIKGLESPSITIDFFNDTAAASVLATLQTNYGSVVAFEVRNGQGIASPTNPKYTGSVLINKLTPVNGKVTDMSMQSLTLTVSGAITYATA